MSNFYTSYETSLRLKQAGAPQTTGWSEMSDKDLDELVQEVMSRTPADRLRIVALLLDTNDKAYTKMAVYIAQAAIDQIRLTRVTR